MKRFLKENGWFILPMIVMFIVFAYLCFRGNVSQEDAQEWISKPLSKLTAGDVLLLVLAHAFINRSDHKCNCKADK